MNGSLSKGTLYIGDLFGYVKLEATQIKYELVDYAQYRNAVQVTFLPKRKRLKRRITKGFRPRIIILEGWGHPEPPGPFQPENLGVAGFKSKKSRHLSCDEAWDTEFDFFLRSYLNATAAKVAIDFRGFEPKEKHF